MRSLLTLGLASALSVTAALAHCQIPCGIYGDDTRFNLIEEHATTIEKSMKQIDMLSGSIKIADANQLVRWVTNKEKHADEIQEIVQQYFLAQRVKIPAEGADKRTYLRMLELLHRIIVYAMKCKQTTDLAHVEALREALHDFRHLYEK